MLGFIPVIYVDYWDKSQQSDTMSESAGVDFFCLPDNGYLAPCIFPTHTLEAFLFCGIAGNKGFCGWNLCNLYIKVVIVVGYG